MTRDDAELPQSPTEALMTPLFGTGVARLAVLVEWTRWNSVRTVASLAAMAALLGGIAAA